MRPNVDLRVDGNGNIVAVGDINVTGNLIIYQHRGKLRSSAELLRELRARSRKYYEELTGPNGPYRHLDITEAILAGIGDAKPRSTVAKQLLEPIVREDGEQVLGLEDSLRHLWQQPVRHALLLGEGGMGKTSSLLNLWHTLLESEDQRILPLFIQLHEYNTVSEAKKEQFVGSRIAWHYLGKRISDSILLNDLWEIFSQVPVHNAPTVVMLLDGFNEVTVENQSLLLELQALREKGRAVQLILSSRYEVNFSWAEDFHLMSLQALTPGQVQTYLEAHQAPYPSEVRLQEVIQNPMMLTLYASANETVEQYKNNSRFAFTPHTTTQGELLWNYLEAQLVKLANIYGDESYEYHYSKFLLRHFLPFLGIEMERQGYYAFAAEAFGEIVDRACAWFYKKDFVINHPEYAAWFTRFDLAELPFPKNEERNERFRTALCQHLGIMLDAEASISFLHQNFRDVFATAHLLQEIKQGILKRRIPIVLKQYPLPIYLRRYLGEITGEVSADALTYKPTVLYLALEQLRGVFETQEVGYAVWNLVAIWKDIRPHLGELDFSRLNLVGVMFNGTFGSRRTVTDYQSASFDGSEVV